MIYLRDKLCLIAGVAWALCAAIIVVSALGSVTTETPEVEISFVPGETVQIIEAVETVQTYEGFRPDIDYMEIMANCCRSGNYEAGRTASEARNQKIASLGLDLEMWDFDELMELSKIITSEAGSSWLPMEWKMKVGEVVLNRVKSPEFPDTIYEVIHQRGQYDRSSSQWFSDLVPYDDCIEAAVRLLNGERLLNDIKVVFQSTVKLGGGVADTLTDPTGYYRNTYLCYTSYPSLYEEVS